MKRYLSAAILAVGLLAPRWDGHTSPPEVILKALPGSWQTEVVQHDGTQTTIYYRALPESVDYSKISAPGDPNSTDPLVVIQGLIFHSRSGRPQGIKSYLASDDPAQKDPIGLARILSSTPVTDWRMTHFVCIGDVLIIRGIRFNRAKQAREIDLWPMSQVQGTWKVQLFSPKAKKIEWLTNLLYADKIALRP